MIHSGFVLLTLLMCALVYTAISIISRKALADDINRKRVKRNVALSLAGWLAYVCVISFSGLLTTTSLPPRVPVFLILPLFVFMVFFFTRQRFNWIINATPVSWLTYTQSFRIGVELLLVSLAINGSFPVAATLEGYNFDILIGVSALAVGYWGVTRVRPNNAMLIAWNLAGLATLAVVIFVVITYAYFPGIWPKKENFSVAEFGSFPFTLLPGFLAPFAIFLHVFSLVKMSRAK